MVSFLAAGCAGQSFPSDSLPLALLTADGEQQSYSELE